VFDVVRFTADAVDKLFSSPVSATLIRPATQTGNNDSRA
jgi:hypothetical protein